MFGRTESKAKAAPVKQPAKVVAAANGRRGAPVPAKAAAPSIPDPEDDPMFEDAYAKEHVARLLFKLRSDGRLQEREANALARFIMSSPPVLTEFQDLTYQKTPEAGLEDWVVARLDLLQNLGQQEVKEASGRSVPVNGVRSARTGSDVDMTPNNTGGNGNGSGPHTAEGSPTITPVGSLGGSEQLSTSATTPGATGGPALIRSASFIRPVGGDSFAYGKSTSTTTTPGTSPPVVSGIAGVTTTTNGTSSIIAGINGTTISMPSPSNGNGANGLTITESQVPVGLPPKTSALSRSLIFKKENAANASAVGPTVSSATVVRDPKSSPSSSPPTGTTAAVAGTAGGQHGRTLSRGSVSRRNGTSAPQMVTVDQLIRKLISDSVTFRDVFMLTYRRLITPDQLLTKLIHYYRHPPSPNDSHNNSGTNTSGTTTPPAAPTNNNNTSNNNNNDNTNSTNNNMMPTSQNGSTNTPPSQPPSIPNSQSMVTSIPNGSSSTLSSSAPVSAPSSAVTPSTLSITPGTPPTMTHHSASTPPLSSHAQVVVSTTSISSSTPPIPSHVMIPSSRSLVTSSSSSMMSQNGSGPDLTMESPPGTPTDAVAANKKASISSNGASQNGASTTPVTTAVPVTISSANVTISTPSSDSPSPSPLPSMSSSVPIGGVAITNGSMPSSQSVASRSSPALSTLEAKNSNNGNGVDHNDSAAEANNDEEEEEVTGERLASRIKVGSVLRYWIQAYFEDWTDAMKKQLRHFCNITDRYAERKREEGGTMLQVGSVTIVSNMTPATPSPSALSALTVAAMDHKAPLGAMMIGGGSVAQNNNTSDNTGSASSSSTAVAVQPVPYRPSSGASSISSLLLVTLDKQEQVVIQRAIAAKEALKPLPPPVKGSKATATVVPREPPPMAFPLWGVPKHAVPTPPPLRLDILKVNAVDCARELTTLEWPLFAKIQPLEITDQMWQEKPAKAPNALEFIKQFNRMADWVAMEILERETHEKRAQAMQFFISLALETQRIHNYHATFYIMAGLTLHPVYRLRDLRGILDTNQQRAYEHLKKVTTPSDNYRAYRPLVNACVDKDIACLPHMAVVFKDLFLLQDPTPHERQTKTIDCNRLQRVATEIQRVMTARTREFNFKVNPTLQLSLRDQIARTRDRDYLLERSLTLEPKMTWKEHRQKLAISVLLEEGFL